MKACLFFLLLVFVYPAIATEPETKLSAVSSHYQTVLQQDEYRQEAAPDFFAQLGRWVVAVLQSLQDSFKHAEYSGQLIRLSYALMWSLFGLCAAALLYWAAKLFRWRRATATSAPGHVMGQRYLDSPESYDREIHRAVTAQLWSTALLLSWRRFLSLLERHRLVTADRTLTNWEYLAQMQRVPVPVRDLCRHLAAAYDQHVYGSRPLTPEAWAQWDASLQAIIRTLKLERPTPP